MSEHEQPVELPAVDTSPELALDHPDEVTEEEAEEGHQMYMSVDDLDDESNGENA